MKDTYFNNQSLHIISNLYIRNFLWKIAASHRIFHERKSSSNTLKPAVKTFLKAKLQDTRYILEYKTDKHV